MMMQRPKTKPWLRLISLITLSLFTATNVVSADMIPQRASSAPALAPLSDPAFKPRISADAMDLPESVGQVKSQFHGAKNQLVIHIQDAHANEEAQRNIARILDYFAQNQGLQWINLEGGEGEFDTRFYSLFPNQKSKQAIANYFLKEAKIAGPEYLAIARRPELRLFGVEDQAIYEENRKAFLDAAGFKERDEKTLDALKRVLDDVMVYVFQPKLLALEKRRAQFESETRELTPYVKFLAETAREMNAPVTDYSRIHALLELGALEESIDFDSAEKELEALTGDVKKILTREKLSRFVENTVQFRLKKMKREDYYGYLEQTLTGLSGRDAGGSPETALADKYAHVLKYLRYMRLYDHIGIEIFDEIQALEKTLKAKLFRNDREVALDRLLKVYEVTRKMFDFSLTKSDAEFFYAFRDQFRSAVFTDFLAPILKENHFDYALPVDLNVLDLDLPRIERFYALAIQRDHVLIERAVDKMQRENQKITAIVTGGFHTPGIERYLRERDISYLVIAPKMNKAFDAKKTAQLYQNAMSQKPLALEEKLTDAYFPPRTGLLHDPHFQLAAPVQEVTRAQLIDLLTGLSKQLSGEARRARAEVVRDSASNFVLFFTTLLMVQEIFGADDHAKALTGLARTALNHPEMEAGTPLAIHGARNVLPSGGKRSAFFCVSSGK